MLCAVTGASGHVGGCLVRELLERGHFVRALVRDDRRALEGLACQAVHGDVLDPASLEAAFRGAEVVFHAAAHLNLLRTGWRLMSRVNVGGTRAVLDACRAAGVRRLVHFSSVHALVQAPFDVPVDEERPLNERGRATPYDRTKALAERAVREEAARGLDAVILNPTAVIGPFDFKHSFLGRFLCALARSRIPALVEGGFDWVDNRDVARAAAVAAERAPAGSRYLLPGRWASVAELSRIAASVLGVPLPRLTVSMSLARFVAPFATAAFLIAGRKPLFTDVTLEALRSNRNISRARAVADLGYRSRDLRETLEDTYRWFRDNGDIPEATPTRPVGSAPG